MSMRVVLLLAGLSVAGCGWSGGPRMVVEGDPARPWSYGSEPEIGGSITWYSTADLDRIVREYVRANNIDYSFRGTGGSFWIARDREYLAHGTYSSGIGKPMLDVEIGWDGYVRKHAVGIVICGIELDESEDGP